MSSDVKIRFNGNFISIRFNIFGQPIVYRRSYAEINSNSFVKKKFINPILLVMDAVGVDMDVEDMDVNVSVNLVVSDEQFAKLIVINS